MKSVIKSFVMIVLSVFVLTAWAGEKAMNE
jgi:hypothetical protein